MQPLPVGVGFSSYMLLILGHSQWLCIVSLARAVVFRFCEPTLALVAIGKLHLVVVAVRDCPSVN